MGLRGDRPLGANAAARRKQRNRQKDQEKRVFSVVESQRAVLQVPYEHTRGRDERERVPGGMEDRDWRIETRLKDRGWWGRGIRMAGSGVLSGPVRPEF